MYIFPPHTFIQKYGGKKPEELFKMLEKLASE